jgi:hypothetical protein
VLCVGNQIQHSRCFVTENLLIFHSLPVVYGLRIQHHH